MKVRVQLTEQDYVSSYWPMLFSSRRFIAVMALAALSTLISAAIGIADLSHGEPVDAGRWVYVLVMVFFAWVIFIGGPSKMRKTYYAQKLHENPYEVELGEERFMSTRDRGYTTLTWPDLLKWYRGKKMIIVYVTERQCVLLPLHAFSSGEDFAAAAAILQSKLGKPA